MLAIQPVALPKQSRSQTAALPDLPIWRLCRSAVRRMATLRQPAFAGRRSSAVVRAAAAVFLPVGAGVLLFLCDHCPRLLAKMVNRHSDVLFGCANQSVLPVLVNERHCLRDKQQSQDD